MWLSIFTMSDCKLYIGNTERHLPFVWPFVQLHEWSYKWQMSFSVSNSCIVSIHRKRTPPTLNYTLGNTLLNVVNSHSYLGVTVSSDLKDSKNMSRYDSVLLNRLRIGHSRLTHSYLLSGDDPPTCQSCGIPLTVKHILVECHNLWHSWKILHGVFCHRLV